MPPTRSSPDCRMSARNSTGFWFIERAAAETAALRRRRNRFGQHALDTAINQGASFQQERRIHPAGHLITRARCRMNAAFPSQCPRYAPTFCHGRLPSSPKKTGKVSSTLPDKADFAYERRRRAKKPNASVPIPTSAMVPGSGTGVRLVMSST